MLGFRELLLLYSVWGGGRRGKQKALDSVLLLFELTIKVKTQAVSFDSAEHLLTNQSRYSRLYLPTVLQIECLWSIKRIIYFSCSEREFSI